MTEVFDVKVSIWLVPPGEKPPPSPQCCIYLPADAGVSHVKRLLLTDAVVDLWVQTEHTKNDKDSDQLVSQRRLLDDLLEFQNTLAAAAEMPEDLEPSQVTPWFVRLIVAAKRGVGKTDDLDARDLAEFRGALVEIAKSPWSPDEALVALTALEASEKRRKGQ